MTDACDLAWKLTGCESIYDSKKCIQLYDTKPNGPQYRKPFWWYGRIYKTGVQIP